MNHIRKTENFIKIACFVVFVLSAINLCSAEKTAFVIGDSLRVKSFSAQSITDDGRFIAGSFSIRRDRLGTDHKRYGDPTYLSPRLDEVVIFDTETKKITPVFESKKRVQGMTWSPDGKTLAFFLLMGDRFVLQIYDRAKKNLKEVNLNTDKVIASNSFLIWTNDGSHILLALRAEEWEVVQRGYGRPSHCLRLQRTFSQVGGYPRTIKFYCAGTGRGKIRRHKRADS